MDINKNKSLKKHQKRRTRLSNSEDNAFDNKNNGYLFNNNNKKAKNSKKKKERKIIRDRGVNDFNYNTFGYLFNNDPSPETETKFNIIKWNARVDFNRDSGEYYSQRGVLNESYNGSYFIDKRFTSNKRGFVVQKIEKKILELKNSILDTKEQKSKTYWEIFYVGSDTVPLNITNKLAHQYYSYSTDGFVQEDCGEESSGHIVQVGTSNFFEYNHPVVFRDNMMVITDAIQHIFGQHVSIDLNTNANGLPISTEPPLMNTLKSSGPTVLHVVEYHWNNTDNETHVKETCYSDDLVFDLMRPSEYENEEIETGGLTPEDTYSYNSLTIGNIKKLIKEQGGKVPRKKMKKKQYFDILLSL